MGESIDPQLYFYLTIAQRAARQAGVLIKAMLDTAKSFEKSSKDLVTDADIAAQKLIRSILASKFPEHAFVGEEEDAAKSLRGFNDRMCWVVDPIDGTANYVHQLPNFAVSIALVRNKVPLVGVIYDPMADEMFCAVQGDDATLNDIRIQSSDCTELSQALVAASFPPNVARGDVEIDQFVNVLVNAQSVRRLGSAALNLCFVACGRLDAYWAGVVRPWDVAAGVLIAKQAGAVLTARNGGPFDLDEANLAVASTQQLHSKLMIELT